jgi:hypothetical protein
MRYDGVYTFLVVVYISIILDDNIKIHVYLLDLTRVGFLCGFHTSTYTRFLFHQLNVFFWPTVRFFKCGSTYFTKTAYNHESPL